MEETQAMRERLAYMQAMRDLSELAGRWAKRCIIQSYGAAWAY